MDTTINDMLEVTVSGPGKRKHRSLGSKITFVILFVVIAGAIFNAGGIVPKVEPNRLLQPQEGIIIEKDEKSNSRNALQIDTIALVTKPPVTLTPTTTPSPTPTCSEITAVDLLLDTSGSMLFDRVGASNPKKFVNMKAAVIEFASLQSDSSLIGAQRFSTDSTDVFLINKYSINKSIIPSAVNNLQASGGTNMIDGLTLAKNRIDTAKQTFPGYNWTLIFLSDGLPLTGSPVNIANAIKQSGVRVITIGLELNTNVQDLMRALASSPSDYYDAPTSEDLQAIYKNISEEICE